MGWKFKKSLKARAKCIRWNKARDEVERGKGRRKRDDDRRRLAGREGRLKDGEESEGGLYNTRMQRKKIDTGRRGGAAGRWTLAEHLFFVPAIGLVPPVSINTGIGLGRTQGVLALLS